MLTYSFENINCPIYEYIYERIRQDILNGSLAPGEKLPSKRSFAKNNGISTITVQNAYDQLISEGYLFTLPKKGYYVSNISGLILGAKTSEASVVTGCGSAAPDNNNNNNNNNNVLLDLSVNRTDPSLFPFSVWARIMRGVISEKSAGLMTPSPTGGIPELRAAIAGHLRSFRGISVSPDQIIIGAGTEYLYSLLIQLLGPDRVYCTENPGYRKLTKIYSQYNVRCRFAEMDDCGIIVDEIERNNTDIAHISPTHHFPTGITMPAARRYEVLNWAYSASDRYIIEDDYDSEFRQNGRPIPPLLSIDTAGRVIYINTFSKSLTPTIRISYMVLPPALAAEFSRRLSFYSCTVSNFEQYTLAEFISGGWFEKHINRLRLYYIKKRRAILQCLAEGPLKGRCSCIENDSGLHFLLCLNTSLTDSEVSGKLRQHGINIDALSDYFLDGSRRDTGKFLINYSNINVEDFRNAISIIAEVI